MKQMLGVYVPIDQYLRFRQACLDNDRTIASVVRELMRKYVTENTNQKERAA